MVNYQEMSFMAAGPANDWLKQMDLLAD